MWLNLLGRPILFPSVVRPTKIALLLQVGVESNPGKIEPTQSVDVLSPTSIFHWTSVASTLNEEHEVVNETLPGARHEQFRGSTSLQLQSQITA